MISGRVSAREFPNNKMHSKKNASVSTFDSFTPACRNLQSNKGLSINHRTMGELILLQYEIIETVGDAYLYHPSPVETISIICFFLLLHYIGRGVRRRSDRRTRILSRYGCDRQLAIN